MRRRESGNSMNTAFPTDPQLPVPPTHSGLDRLLSELQPDEARVVLHAWTWCVSNDHDRIMVWHAVGTELLPLVKQHGERFLRASAKYFRVNRRDLDVATELASETSKEELMKELTSARDCGVNLQWDHIKQLHRVNPSVRRSLLDRVLRSELSLNSLGRAIAKIKRQPKER